MSDWCPENDRAWQAEQAERHGENTLKARIRELEAERDELLATAEQVVNLIEGLDGYGLARSALDETRLKDEPRWVFFYNEVAAQSRTTLAETEGRGDE